MKNLRAVAYCRVSVNHEEQESSLETQISYYGKFISECECWQLVKIYAEQASGTQTKASRVYENDQGLQTRKD